MSNIRRVQLVAVAFVLGTIGIALHAGAASAAVPERGGVANGHTCELTTARIHGCPR